MNFRIEDYLSGAASVCREKRQYTVGLYALLFGGTKVKLAADGFENKNYEINKAYYEPAFLRDYFDVAEDKRAFNLELLNFANEKLQEICKLTTKKRGKGQIPGVTVEELSNPGDEVYNWNLSVSAIPETADLAKHINGWGKEEKSFRNPIARWMMNIKPDFALLLKRKGVKRGEYRLHFIDVCYLAGDELYPACVGTFDKHTGKLLHCYKLTVKKAVLCDLAIEFFCRMLTTQHENGKEKTECPVTAGYTSTVSLIGDRNRNQNQTGVSLEKIQDNIGKAQRGEKVKEPRLLLGPEAVFTL